MLLQLIMMLMIMMMMMMMMMMMIFFSKEAGWWFLSLLLVASQMYLTHWSLKDVGVILRVHLSKYIANWCLVHLLWNLSQVSVTGPHWHITSGRGLVLWDPSHYPSEVLTRSMIYGASRSQQLSQWLPTDIYIYIYVCVCVCINSYSAEPKCSPALYIIHYEHFNKTSVHIT